MSEEEQILLPDGFKKVKYLQSTGNEVIYTGVIPTDKHGFYAEVESCGVTGYACGTQSADGAPGFWIYDSNGVLQASYENNIKTTVSSNSKTIIKNNFLNDRKLVSGTSIVKNYSQDFIYNWSYEFTLFKSTYTSNNKFDPVAPIRIYRFKISENEKIIKDFVPCLDVNDIPCMYDILGTGTIEENTYYNQGTGKFLIPKDLEWNYPFINNDYNLPAGFKKCVYLQSDGTQWIDTSVIPDNETGLYFNALQLSYGNIIPFGVSEGGNAIYPPRFSSKDLYYRWGGTNVKMMTWDKAGDLIFHSSLNLYNSKIAKFNSEDTDVETSITSQTGTYTNPIWLFSYNLNSSYSATYGKWVGRVYRTQITQGTNLIHDYVPCLDADGRPCMYDLIEQEALYNQSGGTEFTYCVEHQLPSDFIKLKYLESDSNLQYIKTDYVPTNNTGMYVDAYNTVAEDSAVMGMQNTTGDDRMWIGGVIKSTYGAKYGWGTITRPNGAGDVRFEASLNWLNDKKSIITCPAFAQKVNTLNDLTFTPNQDIYIFGWNRQGSLLHWKGRIYRAKISEGSEIVRDFVPAYDTRKTRPCMYDLINNVAYYNDGTGEFLYNRDIEGTYTGFTGLSGIGNRLSGNCYHLVNALITDGNCRINLGKGIIDSTISHEFRGYTTDSIKFMFGTSYAGADYLWQGNGMLVWGGKVCNVNSNLEVFVTINANENKVILNGTTYNKNASFNSAEPVCIFDTGRQTSSKWIPAANGSKFYKWVMKKDGIIIHDYRPAIDINFVPCVIDLITGEAFYNTLSGTLTWE
ncbi:MAG: hypothetical protein IJ341_12695 [Bacteroidales bacterium]|nr:hypothetical protein [Bacteroidales bacterium]